MCRETKIWHDGHDDLDILKTYHNNRFNFTQFDALLNIVTNKKKEHHTPKRKRIELVKILLKNTKMGVAFLEIILNRIGKLI